MKTETISSFHLQEKDTLIGEEYIQPRQWNGIGVYAVKGNQLILIEEFKSFSKYWWLL